MIDALTASKGLPGDIQIPNVAVSPLDIESIHCFVVVLVSEQHPDSNTISKQSAQEVGTYKPGGACQEHWGHDLLEGLIEDYG